ncbi:cyclically-permuted mutarotase family protein [Labilibaculum sp. DW002]|uniref:Cyclically-permuted mutarotase family protein n=1 Tax=Paralabilibaculum antarcticum TaxID=2912572 RepID=A0ABT5VMS6_9BACT|nr:cyclically-permuted mutarotase family protein [Labilibaculum sp. DW002]MDE5416718.1 cyclically-permuted mutarotase family protein [Labilibaculum sp. DW002]
MLTLLSLVIFTNTMFVNECIAQGYYKNNFDWKEIPSLLPNINSKVQVGLANPFAGDVNGHVFVVGGCNFPDTPVYEGGKKKYYSDIFILNKNQDEGFKWEIVGSIPDKLAYGASVVVQDGLLCIGGRNSEKSVKDVRLISWNESTRQINVENWPSLPYGMENMGAALVDDKIYVAGGTSDGKVANTFLSLDLNKKGSAGFEWKVLPDFPGPGRVQLVVVAQNEAEERHLFIFGGSSYPENQESATICTDGLEYNPKTEEWNSLPEIQVKGEDSKTLHGGAGIAIGTHHILFVGGVNKDVFRKGWELERKVSLLKNSKDTLGLSNLKKQLLTYYTQETDNYQFNDKVIVFNTITNAWSNGCDYPFKAPTGAPLVKSGKGWFVINGEVKPGVRSPKVYYGETITEPVFGFLNWLVLILYMFGMLYLGYFFMKKEKSSDDFFKGGGRIPWWAAGMSIFATMLSAITFMAIPAKTFATDWKYYPMAITILVMAFPVVKYYLPFFRRLKVTTAYEYLEQRFNYSTRLLASSLFIIFMIARMALVLFLPSLALTVVTGIDIYICIVLMGVITTIYCTMGGVEAVVWGDVIQGFVLMGGAILAVFFLVGGLEGGWNQLIEISMDNSKFTILDSSLDLTKATIWVVLIGGLANNLISYSSDQTVIQRYLTTKDEKSAGKSIVLNGFLSIFVSLIFYLIGTALFAYYSESPDQLHYAMENPDSLFPYYIMTKLPMGLAGLLIAAIFAATMSTVSSNINSLSTAFTSDIYQHFFKGSSDKTVLYVARLSGVIFGGLGIVLAILMATWNILSLFDYFNYILGLLASGLGGLFVMGIFMKRIHSKAALIGFFTGTIILVALSQYTKVHFLLFGFIGMFSSVIIGLIVSFIIPEKKKDLDGLTVHSLSNSK